MVYDEPHSKRIVNSLRASKCVYVKTVKRNRCLEKEKKVEKEISHCVQTETDISGERSVGS